MLVTAVLFDFDGTLTRPKAIDFSAIRKAIDCPPELAILEFLETLDGTARRDAEAQVDAAELASAAQSQPNTAAESVLLSLHAQGIPLGIITRNTAKALDIAFANFQDLRPHHFVTIITRDNDMPPKPHPAGVQHFAAVVGLNVAEVMVVGDFVFDIEAGARAGACTVFLSNHDPEPEFTSPPTHTIATLNELPDCLAYYRPLSLGKLPNVWLERFLQASGQLLVSPGVGEDTCAVSWPTDNDVLVMKSDPITFPTDAPGRYLVTINANDLATSGATARWLLTTLLMPPDSTPAAIHAIMDDIHNAVEPLGVTVAGGHTEITDAVTRPVVVGQLVGTVRQRNLVRKQEMRPGDQLLLTKGIAVEGSCIIASEFAEHLRSRGVAGTVVARAAAFADTPGISIVSEARLALEAGGVSALHDVTEGGLATAMTELAVAGGHSLHVDLSAIPILPETVVICEAMDIQPLGLIGSGSLLICCRPESMDNLLNKLQRHNIEVAQIGHVGERGKRIEVKGIDGQDWPSFATDELARLFERMAGENRS